MVTKLDIRGVVSIPFIYRSSFQLGDLITHRLRIGFNPVHIPVIVSTMSLLELTILKCVSIPFIYRSSFQRSSPRSLGAPPWRFNPVHIPVIVSTSWCSPVGLVVDCFNPVHIPVIVSTRNRAMSNTPVEVSIPFIYRSSFQRCGSFFDRIRRHVSIPFIYRSSFQPAPSSPPKFNLLSFNPVHIPVIVSTMRWSLHQCCDQGFNPVHIPVIVSTLFMRKSLRGETLFQSRSYTGHRFNAVFG